MQKDDDKILHVLIVEDDADVRLVTKLSLSTLANMQVSEAASGDEAISHVTANIFDAILLDVMMPEMDGPTTLNKIRELPNGTATPIIFLTAKVLPSEIERLQARSSYEVITKPFDPLTLGDELQRIMNKPVQNGVLKEQNDASL